LVRNLKALKADLKVWNEEVFGNVEFLKRSLMEELGILDGLEEVQALVDEEKLRKTLVISELERTLLMEEISWRQKSKGSLAKRG
jgi:hypothetical protein